MPLLKMLLNDSDNTPCVRVFKCVDTVLKGYFTIALLSLRPTLGVTLICLTLNLASMISIFSVAGGPVEDISMNSFECILSFIFISTPGTKKRSVWKISQNGVPSIPTVLLVRVYMDLLYNPRFLSAAALSA